MPGAGEALRPGPRVPPDRPEARPGQGGAPCVHTHQEDLEVRLQARASAQEAAQACPRGPKTLEAIGVLRQSLPGLSQLVFHGASEVVGRYRSPRIPDATRGAPAPVGASRADPEVSQVGHSTRVAEAEQSRQHHQSLTPTVHGDRHPRHRVVPNGVPLGGLVRHAPMFLLLSLTSLVACGDKDGDDGTADCVPTGAELDECDGIDDDCDGEIDEDAEDRADWFLDADEDGFGDPADSLRACIAPSGRVDNDLDCDDADDAIHPDATESCNDIDDDCDGLVDDADGDAETTVVGWVDRDEDGWGAGPSLTFCALPEGFVEQGGDCDDQDAEVNPDAEELCDDEGRDEDCDGLVDAEDDDLGDEAAWYPDGDGDGYGADEDLLLTCEPPSDYVDLGGDCDDEDRFVNPGATERCNNDVDDDCDGTSNGCLPADGDVQLRQTHIQIEGDSSNFGLFLTSGDIDGDGKDDLVLADTSASSAYIFDALVFGEDIDVSDATATLNDTNYMGYYLESGADLSGDGVDDVVSMSSSGVVVFEGPLSGTFSSATASAIITVDNPYYNAWNDSLALMDLTGDGQADLVVGEPSDNRVLIYEGPIEGVQLDADDAWQSIEGAPASSLMGGRIVHAGDTDGDGLEELLLADAYGSTSGSTTGEAWLVSGDTLASGISELTDADVKILGSESGDYLGWSADGGQDLNGDGYDDFALGAPNDESQGEGLVSVHLGASDLSATESPSAGFTSASSNPYYAYTLALPGDLDGDGRGDIAIGHLGASGSATYGGAVYVYYSPGTGVFDETDADATIEGSSSSDYVGSGIMSAGDVTGNGHPDLVFSGYGLADVFIWQGGGY